MAWEIYKAISSNGFKHNMVDKCIYSKFIKDYGVIIYLYVDDMPIFSTSKISINETRKYLIFFFKMKDLNEVDTIVGIKVKKHNKDYALNQSHYIEKILNKFNYLNIKDYNTLFDRSIKLIENLD